MRAILYTIAKLESGKLVRAADAEKGETFTCPLCSGIMHLRKSGKTGPNTRRPHFSHKSLTPNCTPESALHFAFKTLAYDKINEAITLRQPLPFSWNCIYCTDVHEGDLLKIATAARLERTVGPFTPDISLVNNNDQVIIVIEIIVTHAPEENALVYYKKNKIPVIEISVQSDTDLEMVADKLAKPNSLTVCTTRPKCRKCDRYMSETELMLVEATCGRCRAPVRVALIHKTFTTVGPNQFLPSEIALARENGAYLTVHSWYRGKENLINTCRQCGQQVDRSLGDYYLAAGYGGLQSKRFVVGFHCWDCLEKEIYR